MRIYSVLGLLSFFFLSNTQDAPAADASSIVASEESAPIVINANEVPEATVQPTGDSKKSKKDKKKEKKDKKKKEEEEEEEDEEDDDDEDDDSEDSETETESETESDSDL